ncbi:MAG: YgiQ family radical SAM protein [Kiritimatiellae bacterium]|nr:YgiQ family radical SAM protein [Kiritimatiellia bacterium]
MSHPAPSRATAHPDRRPRSAARPLTAFIPMTREEMAARGWDALDILIISGDAYVDHPTFGPPLIARVLLDAGYRVGIIAQPDWKSAESLKVLGTPRLGIGVASGNMDSMVKLYTAGRRLRHEDAYSPGGKPGLCPPHAPVVYAQLARQAFPGVPIILGGIEVSLRRVAHYDYWQDKMRPSMLVDAKADLLCYGMGELTMLEIFDRLAHGQPLDGIRGTCRYLGGKESEAFVRDENCVELPSYEEVCSDKLAIMRQTQLIERELNPFNARRLIQRTRGRLLVVEPPRPPLTPEQFDHVCELPFTWVQHWSYAEKIPAWEVVKDSICVVRGCPGGCAFCGLVTHQGRGIVSRTPESVERSIRWLTRQPFFRGTISDLGGPAGNIYGHGPKDPARCRACRRFSCLFPAFCPNYNADEKPLMELLDRVKRIPGVKHVYINSGVRLDLALAQPRLTEKIIRDHVSGQISVAPEHLDGNVLRLMRKGKPEEFERFREIFDRVNRQTGKRQFMVPYFISNFPGSTAKEMKTVDAYLTKNHWSPQQVQDFMPLAMTMGAAMYCSETAPDGTAIPVQKGLAERRVQRDILRKRRG